VLEKYPKGVKLVYKAFPLKNHKYAAMAVTAAFSANEQGKFWQFHDKLFEKYNRLNEQEIRQIAVDLDLDLIAFENGMKSKLVNALIRRDIDDASAAGVRGTPTIFINGKRLNKRNLEGFQEMIDSELKKAEK
jgi:protein-disulfide isomerase